MEWYIVILILCCTQLTLGIRQFEEKEKEENQLMRIPVGPVPRASLRQIFHDDFNHVDHNKWTFDASAAQGGHNEFEIYSPEAKNCYARGGIMFLQPTLTSDHFGENFLHHGVLDFRKKWGYCNPTWNNGCFRDANKDGIMPPIMSCFMRSKTSMKYGKVEIKAKMPRGDWLWPALWLMPTHSHYGGWPRSGEIDMAELLGNMNYGSLGIQRMTSSIHFGLDASQDPHVTNQHHLSSGTYADNYHTYTLDWTAGNINIHVDNVHMLSMATPSDGLYHHYHQHGSNPWSAHNAPFDQEFYILMNVAVGGTGGIFPDGAHNSPHPKPWSTHDNSRVAMEKFWQHKNDWHQTWHGEEAAMKIQSVTMWTY